MVARNKCLAACRAGNIAYLQKHANKMHKEFNTACMLFQLACAKGHLHIAQWLLTVKPSLDICAVMEKAFQLACAKGRLPVAQWLLDTNPSLNVSAKEEEAFRAACVNGHLEVAQWLLTVNPSLDVSAKKEAAFQAACTNGHLEVAQWLLCTKPTLDISANNERAFGGACEKGRLSVAQWLLSVKPSIDVLMNNNYAFNGAFAKGQLPMVKWFFSMKSDKNGGVFGGVHHLFCWACKLGHLSLARWLHQVNPTLYLSAWNERAFRDARFYDRWRVIRWFNELNPSRYRLIRSKEDNRISGYIEPSFLSSILFPQTNDTVSRETRECCICHVNADNKEQAMVKWVKPAACDHVYCYCCAEQHFTKKGKPCVCCRTPVSLVFNIR